jgi:hypothetical protein
MKEDKIGRAYSSHGEMRNADIIVVGKPLGRHRGRWEDSIKMKSK